MSPTGSFAGRKAKAYVNVGTNASPVWVEMKRIKDLKLPLSKGEVEVADREYDWKKFLAGIKEMGITFRYRKIRGTDAVFSALESSFYADDEIQIAICNNPIATTGTKGVKAYFQVFGFDGDESDESPVGHDVALKLTEYFELDVSVEPERFTVGA